MSRKLGAVALAMAILVGAMGVKTVLTAGSGKILTANGPAPPPTKNPFPKKTGVHETALPAVR
jgi:hypothetical protein